MKKKLLSILLALIILVGFGTVAYAAYEYYYPTEVSDNTSTTRAYYPVMLGIDGQTFIDSGKIASSGLDSNMQIGSTSIKYMISTTNITCVIPNLPANGMATASFFTGYTPNQTLFPIITGDGGYFTAVDAANIELTDNFTESSSGYFDATVSGNFTYKPNAYRKYADGSGNVTVAILTANTTSQYSTTSDGDVRNSGAVYATVQAATTGSSAASGANSIPVGQIFSAGTYTVYRGFLFFDTSVIPDDSNITSATLRLYGSADSSVTEFRLTIQNGQPAYPSDPLVVGDYDRDHYSGDGGSYNTTGGWSVAGYNEIPLSAQGLSWISLTGTTKLALRSNRDIDATTPTGAEYVSFYSTDQGGTAQDPQLVINHDDETTTVTATGVASGVRTIAATANTSHLWVEIDGVNSGNTTISSGVSDTSSNLTFMTGNVMPYTDNISISVDGVEQLFYAPNTMIQDVAIPDRAADGTNNAGTIVWGSNNQIILHYSSPVSSATTTATVSAPGGFTLDPVPLPTHWYNQGSDLSGLPFYDAFNMYSSQGGMPVNIIYAVMAYGIALFFFILITVKTKSAFMGVLALTVILTIASMQGVIPGWMIFAVIIMDGFIIFLYKKVAG